MSVSTVTFLFSLAILLAQAYSDELLSVVVAFRHGDRSPVYIYPTDPYDSSVWPVDLGQLTSIGKQQHYALGQWFRKRYDGFLPRKYDNNDIYIRTTDVDRTHMSAQSNLAGLYPPVGDQIWNEDLNWQPIPVHTVLSENDDVLSQSKSCAKYDTLAAELTNSDEIQKVYEDYQEVFEYLTNNTGVSVTSITLAMLIYDTLFIEELYNLTLPSWTSKVYPEPLATLSDFSFTLDTYTPDLARLKAGRVLYEIVDQFNNVLNGTADQKFIMYSAHDSTLSTILNAIGAYDGRPLYANAILFELKRNIFGPYVNILFKRADSLRKITLNQCNYNCKLEKVQSILSPLLISADEWEEECNE